MCVNARWPLPIVQGWLRGPKFPHVSYPMEEGRTQLKQLLVDPGQILILRKIESWNDWFSIEKSPAWQLWVQTKLQVAEWERLVGGRCGGELGGMCQFSGKGCWEVVLRSYSRYSDGPTTAGCVRPQAEDLTSVLVSVPVSSASADPSCAVWKQILESNMIHVESSFTD